MSTEAAPTAPAIDEDKCYLCHNRAGHVAKSDSIPLCASHWSTWIARFLNMEYEPPCGAHLMKSEI